MKKLFLLMTALAFAFQVQVKADEGMWLLSLISQVNMDEMTEMGIELTAEQIYSINNSSVKDAIGALDGGSCTAELVSAEGLLLTNHHCAYGEIQNHSSLENDYLTNGFWAMSKAEELPNEGKTIRFLVRMDEVTDQINPELNEEMSAGERAAKVKEISGKLVAEATEGTHYDARVKSMFNGNRFFIFVTETYLDVRLVGAPPESIGKFGHDTDNWMWPRHTGDFAMLRVYTGPDGKPAPYSPDNVPLKPKHHLPVSIDGVQKDDFAMVMGYPGRTNRYMTSWEIEEALVIEHPIRIKLRGVKQDIMMEDMLADDKVRIQYSSKYSRSSNYWKNSIGMSEALKKLEVACQKRELEAEFTAWVNEDDARKELYGSALADIEAAVAGRADYEIAYSYYVEAYYMGIETFSLAMSLKGLQMALSDPEPEQEKIDGITDKLKQRGADFFKDYNAPTDKKVMTALLSLMIEDLDDSFLPDNLLEVKTKGKGDVAKYVDNYFKKSFLVDEARYMAFMDEPSLKVLEKDPGMKVAEGFGKFYEVMGASSQFEEGYARGSRLFLKGLVEMNPDKDYYSDANSTLRMTYGKVGDYEPADAVIYKYYTTLDGVMEKEDPNNFEFVVSDRLKELYESQDYGQYGVDGTMYVCFTTDNDITGGNSGSPVMNSRGELIGIAFDGNWEAMSGDIAFENEMQKCINVDIRYVLFAIDKYAGAGHLVEEMTLVRKPVEAEPAEEVEPAEEAVVEAEAAE